MAWIRAFCLTAALVAALAPHDARAERRVALVIGNGNYEHAPSLKNPGNDAADIADALQKIGFEVLTGRDLDAAGIRNLTRKFSDAIKGAAVAVFYYAGHGLQVGGKNYIVPVNAALRDESDLDFDMVPLELVLRQMERNSEINLVFLDACRNNPLASNLARSMGTRSAAVGRGLARVETGVGSHIVFATQPGNVALDGGGRNSPFTAALLAHIASPGLDISELMRRVRASVIEATGGKQVPWDHSSLVTSFSFVLPLGDAAGKAGAPDPAVALHACDRLAAHADDPDAVGPGVAITAMNAREAIGACRAAVADEPETRRFAFQLARALLADGEYAESRSWLDKAAGKGHAPAMHRIASLYENGLIFVDGKRLPRDPSAAMTWYLKAAGLGYGASMQNIGRLYFDGRGVERDEKTAASWFLKAAEAGNLSGMKTIADMYFKGVGVDKNVEEGIKWSTRADQGSRAPAGTEGAKTETVTASRTPETVAPDAEARYRGLVEACDALAPHPSDWMRTKLGKPVSSVDAIEVGTACAEALEIKDTPALIYQVARAMVIADKPRRLADLWGLAAERGHVQAMHGLALIYDDGYTVERDVSASLAWLRKAAAAGYAPSMTRLGTYHAEGNGVGKDDAEAIGWYRRGAEGGDPIGMYNLGHRFFSGDGLEKDLGEAARWFLKAAEAGDADAMNAIGAFYDNAMGVPENFAEARRWFEAAVEAGNPDAHYNLGLMHWHGRGAEKDRAKAGPLFIAAADRGYDMALYYAGRALLEGFGVEKETAKAIEYFKSADAKGNVASTYTLGVIYDKGLGTDRDHPQALEWFKKAADAGDLDATFNLALYYDRGIATRLSGEDAAKYLYAALEKGDDHTLGSLSEKSDHWSPQTRKALQTLLRESGHYKGRIDGRYGQSTIEALRRLAGKS